MNFRTGDGTSEACATWPLILIPTPFRREKKVAGGVAGRHPRVEGQLMMRTVKTTAALG